MRTWIPLGIGLAVVAAIAATVAFVLTDNDSDKSDDNATPSRRQPAEDSLQATTPNVVPSKTYEPTVRVDDAKSLKDALTAAKPGDVIGMAAGSYEGAFTLSVTATGDNPVVLTGPAGAVIDGGGVKSGYGVHVTNSAGIVLQGFTITNAQKGVIFDTTKDSVIDGLTVKTIGDEAIHLRAFSTGNVIQNCTITDTGLRKPQFGEGIYLGSAISNWEKYSDGKPDASDANVMVSNKIGPDVRAEHIDIKEGTTGGIIKGNVFDGHGMNVEKFADSWIDVKGNDYQITDNTGSYVPQSEDGGDGFQTHVVDKEQQFGRGNVFARNNVDIGDATGYGVKIHAQNDDTLGNVVCEDNIVSNAEAGIANIPTTKKCPI